MICTVFKCSKRPNRDQRGHFVLLYLARTEQDSQIGQYKKLTGGIVCNTRQLQLKHTRLEQLLSGNNGLANSLVSKMQEKTAKIA